MGLTLLHGLLTAKDGQLMAVADGVPAHRLCQVGDFVAIVSLAKHDLTDPELPPEALAEAALDHNAILMSYSVDRTILPIRFGAAFFDDDAIWRHLSDPQQAMGAKAQFARLEGLQEFAVYVLLSGDPAPPEPGPSPDCGRAFLQKRAQLRTTRRAMTERRSEFATQFTGALKEVTADLRTGPGRPDRLCDLAVLIDRSDASHLDRTIAAFATDAATLGLALRKTGPWPAYSFVADAPELATYDA